MVMQPLVSVSTSELQTFVDAPEQLLQQSEELQLAIASFTDMPHSLLEILVNSPFEQVAEAERLHVNYAEETGDNWQQLVDDILTSRQLGQNDRLVVELLKLGVVPPRFLSEWIPAEKLIQALHTIQMPLRHKLQLFERLAQEPTLEPRLQAAESPETPLAVLEQLAGDLDLPVRLAVKSNLSCPSALIELVEGQYAVASDWNGDSDQLAVLGRSSWDWIRLAVAQNPHAPQETLMELARDEVYMLQFAVAKNPGTSPEILAILAGYEDSKIQNAIAERADITEEIMHQLFPSQQSILERRKDLPASILERIFSDRGNKGIIWFSTYANTPTWILAQLAELNLEALRAEGIEASPIVESIEEGMQKSMSYLAYIAEPPQVSVEILEHLTAYPNPDVQLAVAQNSKTPEELRKRLLQELADSSNIRVKIKLARDPNIPIEIMEKLAGVSSSLDTMTAFLRQLAPNITNSLLEKIRKFIDKHQSPEIILFWLR